jgi:hypothetical protein
MALNPLLVEDLAYLVLRWVRAARKNERKGYFHMRAICRLWWRVTRRIFNEFGGVLSPLKMDIDYLREGNWASRVHLPSSTALRLFHRWDFRELVLSSDACGLEDVSWLGGYTKLRTLRIRNYIGGDEAAQFVQWKTITRLTNLEKLRIWGIGSREIPDMRGMRLKALSAIGRYIQDYEVLTPPTLEKLSCYAISVPRAQGFTSLRVLKVESLEPNLRTSGLRMGSLRKLAIKLVHEGDVKWINLQELEELKLGKNMTSFAQQIVVTLNQPRLRKLKCVYKELVLNTPVLEHLSISYTRIENMPKSLKSFKVANGSSVVIELEGMRLDLLTIDRSEFTIINAHTVGSVEEVAMRHVRLNGIGLNLPPCRMLILWGCEARESLATLVKRVGCWAFTLMEHNEAGPVDLSPCPELYQFTTSLPRERVVLPASVRAAAFGT